MHSCIPSYLWAKSMRKGCPSFSTPRVLLALSCLLGYHFNIPVMSLAKQLSVWNRTQVLFSGISKICFPSWKGSSPDSQLPSDKKTPQGGSQRTHAHTSVMKRCIDDDSSSCGRQLKYTELKCQVKLRVWSTRCLYDVFWSIESLFNS